MKVTPKYLKDDDDARMVPDKQYELCDGCEEPEKGA